MASSIQHDLTPPLRIKPECDPGYVEGTVPTRYHVFNAEGYEIVSLTCSQERAEFIVACVNALAGAEDPEAFITGLRNTLSHTVDHLRKMLEKVAGSDGIMLRVDQDAARNQARRADALLKEIDSR